MTSDWIAYGFVAVVLIGVCIRTIAFANEQLWALQYAVELEKSGEKQPYWLEHGTMKVPNNRLTKAIATNRFGAVVAIVTAPIWVSLGCIGLILVFIFYVLPVMAKEGLEELSMTIKLAKR